MDFQLFATFATVALAHFLALLSPGPDFVLVVKSAVQNRGKTAIGVAAGIASANAVYIALCLIGVGAIFASSIVFLTMMKLAGGLFLTYLAFTALKAKRSDYSNIAVVKDGLVSQSTFFKEFSTGFLSGILNPKNPLFYLSLFTVVLNSDISMIFKVALGIWMTLIVFVWDAFIIFVLSKNKIRNLFNKTSFYIDKCTGTILGAFGLTLIYSSLFESRK